MSDSGEEDNNESRETGVGEQSELKLQVKKAPSTAATAAPDIVPQAIRVRESI